MAKFQTKIKANLNHLMEYVHNSIRPDQLPAALLDNITMDYDNVKIIFRKYSAAHLVIVIYTAKNNEDYICVDVLETGTFGNKWVFEGGGLTYEQYLADMFSAYNPEKTGADNRYVPHIKPTLSFRDKIKNILK